MFPGGYYIQESPRFMTGRGWYAEFLPTYFTHALLFQIAAHSSLLSMHAHSYEHADDYLKSLKVCGPRWVHLPAILLTSIYLLGCSTHHPLPLAGLQNLSESQRHGHHQSGTDGNMHPQGPEGAEEEALSLPV